MGYLIGFNAKAYYLPRLDAGTNTPKVSQPVRAAWPATGIPATAVLLGNISDASLSMETEEADVTTRKGNGWRQKVGTLRSGEIEFTMLWDPADDDFRNVQYCFFNQLPFICAFFDRDPTVATTGYRIQGLYADFSVLNFTRSEDLTDAIKAEVKLSVAPSTLSPEWVDRTHA